MALEHSKALEILNQLRAANQKSCLVEPFVQDYQAVLHTCRVKEVQVGQLSKECTFLREEVVNKEEKLMEVASKLEKIRAAEKMEQELKKARSTCSVLESNSICCAHKSVPEVKCETCGSNGHIVVALVYLLCLHFLCLPKKCR